MSEMCYKDFIDNILNTRGRFGCGDEYHERHHVVPKCMNGTNEESNLIDLFPHEHYEAHRLLALENPENNKLQIVWWLMRHHRRDGDNYEITANEYAAIKKRLAQILSEMHKGRIMSEATRRKMSEAKTGKYDGEKNPMYGVPSPNKGKHASIETRKKQSESAKARYEAPEEHKKSSDAQKKRFENPEERAKISGENHWLFGRCHSEKSRQKMSESQKERLKNPEDNPMYGRTWWDESTPQEKIDTWKARISEANSGENNPNYGKHLSEETKNKISQSNKGKKYSNEVNKKKGSPGGKHPRARKVIRLFDLKIYDYSMAAAQDNNVCIDTIRKLCRKNKDFMYYEEWLTLQNDYEHIEV